MIQEKIQRFLGSKSLLPKIIVIYGPTACGKSAFAVETAHILKECGLNPHIISADSRQIYRGLDIGTGKITKEEMQRIPHHMIDIIDPSETYSMVDFRRDVDALDFWKAVNSQLSVVRGAIPIICGGTGLYIDAILYDMAYPENPPDWGYREELETIRQKEGNQVLWNILHEVDPKYAEELIPENYRYVMRGLEVWRATGKSKRESHNTKTPRFSPLFLTPYIDGVEDRKDLYKRIDSRVEKMFDSGLTEEVGYNIYKYNSHCPGLATIGYKEVVEHLEGKYTLTETLSLVQQHSRNYAKRQITWNKRYEGYSLSIQNK